MKFLTMSDAEFLEHLLHNPSNPSPSYLNEDLARPLAPAVGQLLEPLPNSFEPNWLTGVELELFGISYDSHSLLGTLNMLEPQAEISVPERKPSTTMTPHSLNNPTVWVDELIGSSSSLGSEALHDSRARELSSIE